MAFLNVNTDSLVALTNRLERIRKWELPIAVRNTLTKAARLTKTESLPKVSRQIFTIRSRSFFKAKSKFKGAEGLSLRTMIATVGMLDVRLSDTDHAVRDLEQQESGGVIKGRSFIPTDQARKGGSSSANVAARNRLSNIDLKSVVRLSRAKGKTKSQRFIKSAIFAKKRFGKRAYVLTQKMLFRIDRLNVGKKTNKVSLKITPLYSHRKGRTVRVKATNFMRKSSLIQAKKIDIIFKNEAEKRIKKAKL